MGAESCQFDSDIQSREVRSAPLGLAGTLNLPKGSRSLVIFAHGSGSSRFSPRNRTVGEALNGQGIATLLFDLLTIEEERNRTNRHCHINWIGP